jgi:hypothetical protein
MLPQLSFVIQVAEAAFRASARLAHDWKQQPVPLLTSCASLARTSLLLVTGGALCDAAAAEVPQVLQACTSLLLTIASCTQRSNGVFFLQMLRLSAELLDAVLFWKSRQQQQQQQQGHADVFAYQLLSACWFLLGRCLLQLSPHLQRCALEPDCHSVWDWLLPAASLKSAVSVVRSKSGQIMARRRVNELISLLEQLNVVVKECASNMSSSSSSSGDWAGHCAVQLRTAYQALSRTAGPAAATLAGCWPELLAQVRALQGDNSSSSAPRGPQRKGLSPVIHNSLLDVASGLGVAGEALCTALPTRFCCNNPSCSSTAGASAGFALVRGKACVCGGCVGLAAGAAVPQDAVAAR